MKNLLLTLLAVFAMSSALGQNHGQNHAVSGELKRTGFTKFTIDGQKFSLRDADKHIGDAATIDWIEYGITLEKVAIGLGVSGPAFVGAGFGLFISGAFGAEHGMFAAGLTLMSLGSAMSYAAIVLGATGASITKRAVLGYNSYRNHPEMRLGLAPTPGGLGLQLTF